MSQSPFPVAKVLLGTLIGAGCGGGAAMAIRLAQSVNGPPDMSFQGILIFTGVGAFIGFHIALEITGNRAEHAAVRDPSGSSHPVTGSIPPSSTTLVAIPDWQTFLSDRKSLQPLPIEHPPPLTVSKIARIFGWWMLFFAMLLPLNFGEDLVAGRVPWQPVLWVMLSLMFASVLIVILMIGRYYLARRTTESLGAVATRFNLGFALQADEGLREALQSAAVLPGGQISEVLSGQTDSQNVAVFVHTYTMGSDEDKSTHHQTVACFRFPESCFPAFSMRPQTFSDNVYLWAKPIDFNFASHPTFSREYLLAGENEAAVRGLFKPPVLDHLEKNLGLGVAGNGAVLVVYRPDTNVSPEKTPAFLEEAFGVAAAFVKAVLQRSVDHPKSSQESRKR